MNPLSPAQVTRGYRNPRFEHIHSLNPMKWQTFLVHPLLPNETLTKMSLGGRLMLHGTKSFVSPWWLDVVVFVVPLSTIDQAGVIEAFDQGFHDPAPPAAFQDSGANKSFLQGGQANYSELAYKRFFDHYIKDQNTAASTDDLIWPLPGKETLDWTDDDTIWDNTTVENMRGVLLQMFEEDDTYQEALEDYGIKGKPRSAPEVFIWRRSKQYPVITNPDDASETLNVGQILWSVGYKSNKVLAVKEPSILVGGVVVRPQAVNANRQYATANVLYGGHEWLRPPVEPENLMGRIALAHSVETNDFENADGQIAFNLANYYMHGESSGEFKNDNVSAQDQIHAHCTDLPKWAGGRIANTRDLTQAEAEAMLTAGYYAGFHLDMKLNIKTPVVSR